MGQNIRVFSPSFNLTLLPPVYHAKGKIWLAHLGASPSLRRREKKRKKNPLTHFNNIIYMCSVSTFVFVFLPKPEDTKLAFAGNFRSQDI